jgi:hypothetical protein
MATTPDYSHSIDTRWKSQGVGFAAQIWRKLALNLPLRNWRPSCRRWRTMKTAALQPHPPIGASPFGHGATDVSSRTVMIGYLQNTARLDKTPRLERALRALFKLEEPALNELEDYDLDWLFSPRGARIRT